MADSPAAPKLPATAEVPTQAIIRPQSRNIQPLVPQSYDEAWRLAQGLSIARCVPKQLPGEPNSDTNIAATFAVIQQGATVGLPPMSALGAFTMINGRLAMWGDGQLAVVLGQPDLEEFSEWHTGDGGGATLDSYGDDFTAWCRIKRAGREPVERSFSVADAKLAGLWGKETWGKYPTRMSQLRARAFCLRDTYSDVLLGFQHSAEELIDIEPEPEAAPPMPIASDYVGPEVETPAADPPAPDAEVIDDVPFDDDAGGGQEGDQESMPSQDEAGDTWELVTWDGEVNSYNTAAEAYENAPILLQQVPDIKTLDAFWADNNVDALADEVDDEDLRQRVTEAVLVIMQHFEAPAADPAPEPAADPEPEPAADEGPDLSGYVLPMQEKDGAPQETAWYNTAMARLRSYDNLADFDNFVEANKDTAEALSGVCKSSYARLGGAAREKLFKATSKAKGKK